MMNARRKYFMGPSLAVAAAAVFGVAIAASLRRLDDAVERNRTPVTVAVSDPDIPPAARAEFESRAIRKAGEAAGTPFPTPEEVKTWIRKNPGESRRMLEEASRKVQ